MKKLIYALLVVAALFLVVMPAAAQGPSANAGKVAALQAACKSSTGAATQKASDSAVSAYDWASFVCPNTVCGAGGCAYTAVQGQAGTQFAGRTVTFPVAGDSKPRPAAVLDSTIFSASTWSDPFGGYPILGPQNGLYTPGTAYTFMGPQWLWGPTPSTGIANGGVPSRNTGNGMAPRQSIMLGGVWRGDANGNTYITDAGTPNPQELPTCATVTVPPGQSRWFKMDSWKNSPDGQYAMKLQIWVDEEANGATVPSGSSIWGAANGYMVGTTQPNLNAGGDQILGPEMDWQYYIFSDPGFTDPLHMAGPYTEGFVLAVYDPDAMKPNYVFPAPNATLYTVAVSGVSQGVKRTCTADAYNGTPCIPGITFPPAGTSVCNIVQNNLCGLNRGNGFNIVEGYGQWQAQQPSHTLFYESGGWDGWVHARLYNQMVWPGTATVCSFRAPRNITPATH